MTPERVIRETDEKLYQPKIHSDRIKELYRIKTITHLPITVLVDMAIAEFIEKMDLEMEKPDDCHQEKPYNPWDDPEDLTTYLEPYQND
jgi:hypothetical protein